MTEKLGRMLEMTAGVAANYVVKHKLPAAEIPGLIASVYGALAGVAEGTAVEVQRAVTKATPAQIRKSITTVISSPSRTASATRRSNGTSVFAA